jgi:hypothetical protein
LSTVATLWLDAANVIGWLAAAMTLLTFHCNDMLRLRLLALSANVAFVAYGLAAGLLPVLALHLLLIPLNLLRLRQVRRLLRVAAAPVRAAAAAPAPPGPAPASAREAVGRRAARAPLGSCASSLRRANRRILVAATAPAPVRELATVTPLAARARQRDGKTIEAAAVQGRIDELRPLRAAERC